MAWFDTAFANLDPRVKCKACLPTEMPPQLLSLKHNAKVKNEPEVQIKPEVWIDPKLHMATPLPELSTRMRQQTSEL